MRVTPDCNPLNNFTISAASGIQFNPDLAYGGGNYLAVWVDGRAGGTKYRIFGSRVTPTGTALDPAGIQISQNDTLYHYSTAVTYNGTDFFAVWCNIYPPARVLGRFIKSDGSMSDTCRIASTTGNLYKVRVAWSGSNYLVAWNENITTMTCKGQIVGADGVPVGSPFTIATNVFYPSLGLCWDGTQYCVTYILQTGYQLWGQKFDLTGAALGPAFRVSTSANSHYYAEVIPGANNRYFNVWSETVGSYYDIIGNLDIGIVGVAEDKSRSPRVKEFTTRFVAGPLNLTAGGKTRLLDISGREIENLDPAPGVYFLETGGAVTTRIIKVR